MRPMLLLLCTVSALVPALAVAADVELQSKIAQVTVFPDAAVVTRVAPLDLPAGAPVMPVFPAPSRVSISYSTSPAVTPPPVSASGKGSRPSSGAESPKVRPANPGLVSEPNLYAVAIDPLVARDRVQARRR